MIHKTLSNKIKLKTNAEPIYKISFLGFSSDFFPKNRHYYAFIVKQVFKNIVFE
jgi:hypothetical protein